MINAGFSKIENYNKIKKSDKKEIIEFALIRCGCKNVNIALEIVNTWINFACDMVKCWSKVGYKK
jgi:hypothetical protein